MDEMHVESMHDQVIVYMTNPLVGHVLDSHSHVLVGHVLAWGLVGHVMSHMLGHMVGHVLGYRVGISQGHVVKDSLWLLVIDWALSRAQEGIR